MPSGISRVVRPPAGHHDRPRPTIRAAAAGGVVAVVAVVAGLFGGLVLGGTADHASAQGRGRGGDPPALRTSGVFAAVEIVDVEGEVLRLDTRTGAMHGFEGDTSFTGTSTSWRVRVEPVNEATSGFLGLERRLAGGRTVYVLVDEVTGETWLLRYRERDRGGWSRLSVQVP